MNPDLNEIKAPIAKKITRDLIIHNSKRHDPYYWLRDDNRTNEAVLAHLAAENHYAKVKLAPTESLQQTLYEEITSRLEPDETSVPAFYKGYWYSYQFEEGCNYPAHARQKETLSAKKVIFLDENLRAGNSDFYQLGAYKVSPNQSLLAIAEDLVGRRQYEIRFKDLFGDRFYPEVIENASTSLVWANDNQTFFYVKKHPVTLLPYQVYQHRLGSPTRDDKLIYEELDPTFYTYLFKTRSENFIAIAIDATNSSEVRLLDANAPNETPRIFLKRRLDCLYHLDHIDNHFYLQTDRNAPNGKIVKVSQNAWESKQEVWSNEWDETWKTIVSHSKNRLIQGFQLFNEFMVINERLNGLEKLRIRDLQGKILQEIQFNETAYTIDISTNLDPNTRKIRYFYSSMTTPDKECEYDLDDQSSRLLKQDKVLGDFDSDNYRTERITITTRDKKRLPISLVYRKDQFEKNGVNPLLNYAYGAYGEIIDPMFDIARLSLLDRGFVYAISHVRGGKMLGRQWYEDGKKLSKLNSFNDFIDATKELIAQGYANPEKIYAAGGSAGGLLMGGVVNIAPELFHGVLAAVPFVDVVTTMLDDSIPLTTGEYDEWGDPKQQEFYEYMLSYSPYDQVTQQGYPNLLVTTGLHDSQVQYWEPVKWVAKLRDLKTDNNLLVLDIDMGSGHGGKSGRYRSFEDTAKEYAFVISLSRQAR